MVFVIQNTQNRDTASLHIKIDELIRVTRKARNVLLDLEELDDKTLEMLRKDYEKLARKAKSAPRRRSAPRRCRTDRRARRRQSAKGLAAMHDGEGSRPRPGPARNEADRPKRFYKDVAVKDEAHGRAAILLDGKTVRTPGKAPLVLPNRGAGRGGRRGVARRRARASILRPCRSPGSPTASSTAS